MRYQKIESKIWNDERFTKLTHSQQLLWFYILTCPHGNLTGCYVLKEGYVTADLKITPKDFQKDLAKLLDKDLVNYDYNTEIILVKNFLKHNPLTNPNQKKAAVKILSDLPKSQILRHFLGLIEGLPEGLGEVHPKPETETEEETVKDKSSLAQNRYQKDNGFDQFWHHYPRKVGKPKALATWKSLDKRKRLPPLDTVISSLNDQKTWEQWQEDDGKYIPYPSTWLNREGWNDQKSQPEDRMATWATK